MLVTCQSCGQDSTIPDNTSPSNYRCGHCNRSPVVKSVKEPDKTGQVFGAGAGAAIGALGGPVGAVLGALVGYVVGEAASGGKEGTVVRKVFYSFHYAADSARASLVRNYGVVEGSRPAADNDWESVKRGGDAAIERWIASQLEGRSCLVVLIGSQTAGRKWINHEIIQAWNKGIGVFGIHIHRLSSFLEPQVPKGVNPFSLLNFQNGNPMSTVVQTYDPPFADSKQAYAYIGENLSAWVEAAIKQRQS